MRINTLGDLEKFVMLAIFNSNNHCCVTSIKEELKAVVNKSISTTTIYTVLERLSNKNFVTHSVECVEKHTYSLSRKIKVNFYIVTELGEAKLNSSLDDLSKMSNVYLGNKTKK